MTEVHVHDFWTQFWAIRSPDGWRLMYAVREGMHYAEGSLDGSHSEADVLTVLRRTRGTRLDVESSLQWRWDAQSTWRG